MPSPVRVAMWSCSRNLSTALMRSFGSRADAEVVDEPLYAAWLDATGAPHPMREAVLRSQPRSWAAAVAPLLAPLPPGKTLRYEKHISKHLLPEVGRGWLDGARHAFLIREPGQMLRSFHAAMEGVTVDETGLPQQAALWTSLRERAGVEAPVVAAEDLAARPEPVLRALCAALDLPWDPAMLRWEPGPRPTDGVWGPHWYRSVWASTGFTPMPMRDDPLPEPLRAVEAAVTPAWAFLQARRLRA